MGGTAKAMEVGFRCGRRELGQSQYRQPRSALPHLPDSLSRVAVLRWKVQTNEAFIGIRADVRRSATRRSVAHQGYGRSAGSNSASLARSQLALSGAQIRPPVRCVGR